MLSNRSSRVRGRSVASYLAPLATLLVVVVATSASGRYFEDETIQIYRQRAVVAANVERLKYYDAVLTDSARLAAATNDPAHERLYTTTVPKLDRLLKATVELVDTPEARWKIAQTSASNEALVAIELRSFQLNRTGHSADALALLEGPAYSREKRAYEATSAAAHRAFLVGSDARTHRVDQNRLLALLIAALGAIVLVVIGGLQLRLKRDHDRAAAENERTAAENERSRHSEARRAAAEREYHATQREFTEIMQITRDEDEAYGLLKRHLERSVEGCAVAVLNRNNSNDRLEVMTELPAGSPLLDGLKSADPESCLAIRTGKIHERSKDREGLLSCELCGLTGARSTCVPSLVGGEVIGAVLVEHPSALESSDKLRVEESMAQASPVLANLRNMAISQTRALTDGLTGLPNRRSIDDTLKRMAAHADRSSQPLAAVLFDLDHFKQINDLCGHEKGDEVLAAVGAVVTGSLRASDFAGRYGGEEFIVLLPDTDREAAVVVAEKLRRAVSAIDVAAVPGPITVSLGVAALPGDAAEPTFLLRAADRALYIAKANGKNRVETLVTENAEILATKDPDTLKTTPLTLA